MAMALRGQIFRQAPHPQQSLSDANDPTACDARFAEGDCSFSRFSTGHSPFLVAAAQGQTERFNNFRFCQKANCFSELYNRPSVSFYCLPDSDARISKVCPIQQAADNSD